MIESPVTPYEINRAEFAIILEEENLKKRQAFLKEILKALIEVWKESGVVF